MGSEATPATATENGPRDKFRRHWLSPIPSYAAGDEAVQAEDDNEGGVGRAEVVERAEPELCLGYV